jgi:hypothetical protein
MDLRRFIPVPARMTGPRSTLEIRIRAVSKKER